MDDVESFEYSLKKTHQRALNELRGMYDYCVQLQNKQNYGISSENQKPEIWLYFVQWNQIKSLEREFEEGKITATMFGEKIAKMKRIIKEQIAVINPF